MVGLGVAVALLVIVIAIGHAIFGQLTEAARVVLIFLEVAACAVLTLVVLMLVGLVLYRGQLARLHLAERRAEVAQLAERGASWRVEVLEGGAEGALGESEGVEVPARVVPALPRADVSALPRIDVQPHVVTGRVGRPRCARRDGGRS
jgi:hypothetical protein